MHHILVSIMARRLARTTATTATTTATTAAPGGRPVAAASRCHRHLHHHHHHAIILKQQKEQHRHHHHHHRCTRTQQRQSHQHRRTTQAISGNTPKTRSSSSSSSSNWPLLPHTIAQQPKYHCSISSTKSTPPYPVRCSMGHAAAAAAAAPAMRMQYHAAAAAALHHYSRSSRRPLQSTSTASPTATAIAASMTTHAAAAAAAADVDAGQNMHKNAVQVKAVYAARVLDMAALAYALPRSTVEFRGPWSMIISLHDQKAAAPAATADRIDDAQEAGRERLADTDIKENHSSNSECAVSMPSPPRTTHIHHRHHHPHHSPAAGQVASTADSEAAVMAEGALSLHHHPNAAYAVIFGYGAIVFFNVSEELQQKCLALVPQYTIESIPHLVTLNSHDDYKVEVNPNATRAFDFVPDCVHMRKFDLNCIRIISTVLAQSVTMDHYEEKVSALMTDFRELNSELEVSRILSQSRWWHRLREEKRGGEGGRSSVSASVAPTLGAAHATSFSTAAVNKKRTKHAGSKKKMRRLLSGRLEALIGANNGILNDVLVQIRPLDRSDVAWRHGEYDDLWHGLRDDFEISQRFEILNLKLELVRDNTRFFLELLNEHKSHFLEKAIIALILIEILLMLWDRFEIVVDAEGNDEYNTLSAGSVKRQQQGRSSSKL